MEERTKENYNLYYEKLGKIGKGAFGDVYKAKLKENNEFRAMKFIDLDDMKQKINESLIIEDPQKAFNDGLKDIINELENMKICSNENRNDNSVKYYEYFKSENEFVIIMELCDCNLKNLLKDKNSFSAEEIYFIMKQLNNTFKIMEEKQIVHRDIKLENILIKFKDEKKKDYFVKLTDYGISKRITNTTMAKSKKGTLITMAPKIIKNEGEEIYSYKCDLWSIGVIIYQLFFKDDPFHGESEIAILNNIKNKKNLKSTNNEHLDNLIENLLKEEPKDRLSWEQYFQHPFFMKDWKDFYEVELPRIAKGGFAEVYKVKIKNKDNEFRAIKILDLVDIKQKIDSNFNIKDPEKAFKKSKKDIFNELNNMIICSNHNKNENSIGYYDYFETEKEFAIVMELCDSTLLKILKENGKGFSTLEIYNIMKQLNNTFKIMKENNIVHRDIKLENILIKNTKNQKSNFIVKLTDYGISKRVTNTTMCKTHAGTSLTMAPEILKGEEKEVYSYKVDLWSIGIIIFQLFFRDYPFKGNTESLLLEDINEKENLPSTNNQDLDDLIKRLLNPDPEKRLSWDEYFNHKFFTKPPVSTITGTNKINSSNSIIIKVKIDKDRDQFNNIYFLENINHSLNKEKYLYKENFFELNNENCTIYINNERVEFKKYFKPNNKDKEYTIKIELKEKMKNCSYMFFNCPNIISIDLSKFDSSEVKTMDKMLYKCFFLEKINLENLDTSKVENMQYMFGKCKNLKEITFPTTFKTNNVNDISYMFFDCNKLEKINNLCFDTKKVKSMHSLFQNCYLLQKLDLTSFSTENVTDMVFMFYTCCKLEEIKIDPQKFKTSKVKLMSSMFYQCESLKNFDFSGFDTENVEFMNDMFTRCEKFNNIDLSNFNTKNVKNMKSMFNGCTDLQKLNISSFRDKGDLETKEMLSKCPNLKEVKINGNNIVSQDFEKISFMKI